jgi:tripartite-type tricarboxylate transporter receptor subunit TctC
VIADPEVMEAFRKAGGRPLGLTAGEARTLVQRDVQRWTQLIRDAGIKSE